MKTSTEREKKGTFQGPPQPHGLWGGAWFSLSCPYSVSDCLQDA